MILRSRQPNYASDKCPHAQWHSYQACPNYALSKLNVTMPKPVNMPHKYPSLLNVVMLKPAQLACSNLLCPTVARICPAASYQCPRAGGGGGGVGEWRRVSGQQEALSYVYPAKHVTPLSHSLTPHGCPPCTQGFIYVTDTDLRILGQEWGETRMERLSHGGSCQPWPS